jgi:hypothetical protein
VKNINIGIGYSKTLEEGYNATTANKQSIGIASTWWGLYSIQSPPAFMTP